MKRNEKLLPAAVGLALCLLAHFNEAEAAEQRKIDVQCYGINTKAEQNGCSTTKSEIQTANAVYKNAYAKSKTFDCAGMSECSAKKGNLAWISKSKKEDCLKLGGFLIKKGPDAKYTIEDENGIKKPG